MDEKTKIVNKPLSLYIQNKDNIIIRYKGLNLIILLKTIFLVLAIKKYLKTLKDNTFKVYISCNNSLQKWIPDSIEIIDLFSIENYYPILGIYDIKLYDFMISNHHEICSSLDIKYPLDIKDFLFYDNEKEDEKSVLLCCSGDPYIALPDSIEKDLYEYYRYKGFNVKIAALPDNNYPNNYWALNKLTYFSSYNEILKEINKSNIIISTDNYILHLSNSVLNKKVIGIFGLSIPSSILKHNSMKIIQIKDEEPIFGTKKSCACNNPKYCHRQYKTGQVPYCFQKINSTNLIKKINELL